MEIVLASSNRNKIKELRAVAESFGVRLYGAAEYAKDNQLEPLPEIEETGSTYEENAYLKASTCFRWCGMPSLGDDSGLEVEALGGAPGLYSARYAGVGASDSDKIDKLQNEILALEEEKQGRAGWVKNRNALFRSVLCLISTDPDAPLYFEGTLSGFVLDDVRGDRGFGYDPIIYIPELGGTLAEMSEEIVHQQGFRAKAAKKLFSSFVF